MISQRLRKILMEAALSFEPQSEQDASNSAEKTEIEKDSPCETPIVDGVSKDD